MKLIEEYIFNEEGYSPYLITEGWQIAKLNWLPTHGFEDMIDLESHFETDEAFILLCGEGVLVCGEQTGEEYIFTLTKMTKGVTYNIPKGVMHNIGMSRDAEIIIVEKDNTHLNDVTHYPLSEVQQAELRDMVVTLYI